jgi:hypothetical protein
MKLKQPCLIAETPRAGRWNGCLIVPEGIPIDQATAVRYTTEARKYARGRDYFMVNHVVVQPTTGRKGQELLILAGIDIRALSRQEGKELEDHLRDHLLVKLEELVMNKVEWDQHRQPSLIARPELCAWLDELPLARDSRGGRRQWSPWVVALGLLIFSMITLAFLWGPPGRDRWRRGQERDGIPKDTEGDTLGVNDKLLVRELESWSEDLGLGRHLVNHNSEDLEDDLHTIVETLEERLVLAGRRSDRKRSGLYRFGQLLVDYKQIDPRDRKSTFRNTSRELMLDQGLRKDVVGLYKRLEAGDAAYAYFEGRDGKWPEVEEQLIRPNVEQFRRMIKDAREIIDRAKHSGLGNSKPDKLILESIRRAEADSVKDLRWSFYVHDDLQAMGQLKSLMTEVVNAKEGRLDRPSSKGGPDAPFLLFIVCKEYFDGMKDGKQDETDGAVYKGLYDLAEDAESYLASSAQARAQQEQPRE